MSESLTITSIFLLGCLHALEPGHGKTFLLAYTIGGKLDFQKIVLLTASLLVSHFFVLSIIAIIFNLIISEIASTFLHEFSHWLAPGIVISFGTYILARAIYKAKHVHSDDCGHEHGKFTMCILSCSCDDDGYEPITNLHRKIHFYLRFRNSTYLIFNSGYI